MYSPTVHYEHPRAARRQSLYYALGVILYTVVVAAAAATTTAAAAVFGFLRPGVAVQVAFERKTLKPVFSLDRL